MCLQGGNLKRTLVLTLDCKSGSVPTRFFLLLSTNRATVRILLPLLPAIILLTASVPAMAAASFMPHLLQTMQSVVVVVAEASTTEHRLCLPTRMATMVARRSFPKMLMAMQTSSNSSSSNLRPIPYLRLQEQSKDRKHLALAQESACRHDTLVVELIMAVRVLVRVAGVGVDNLVHGNHCRCRAVLQQRSPEQGKAAARTGFLPRMSDVLL